MIRVTIYDRECAQRSRLIWRDNGDGSFSLTTLSLVNSLLKAVRLPLLHVRVR